LNYTGIVRETKDFDLFLRKDDLEAGLQALREPAITRKSPFPHWLAKAKQGNDVVDSSSARATACAAWTTHGSRYASEADVLGMPVKIAPAEELLWQKAFVMEPRTIRRRGRRRNHCAVAPSLSTGEGCCSGFDPHWQLLLSYSFCSGSSIHPNDTAFPPRHDGAANRLQQATASAPDSDRVCRGTLMSRGQYLLDIGRYGYADARLQPAREHDARRRRLLDLGHREHPLAATPRPQTFSARQYCPTRS
jgi:hypothetical protein